MLAVLGLGCGPEGDDDGETVGACLFCAPEDCGPTSSATSSGSETGTTGTSASSTSTTATSADESEVGPCLAPMPPDLGATESGSSGATDTSGSGSDGEGETTIGPCLEPPGGALPSDVPPSEASEAHARSWSDAFARVAGSLPADVAAKLAARTKRDGS